MANQREYRMLETEGGWTLIIDHVSGRDKPYDINHRIHCDSMEELFRRIKSLPSFKTKGVSNDNTYHS